MGIAVARKKLKAKATAPVPAPGQVEQRIEQISARPELGEKGLDGIGNFGGDLQAEANTELIRELAYGRSGTRTWGEWEKRTRTDPAAAMALDFVLAPVRDARGDVTPADETPAAQQQADFIRWALFENLAPGWAEVTQQSVRGSLGCGFAVHELVWGEVEHPTLPGGRGVTVVELAERLPSSMSNNAWQEDDKGQPDRHPSARVPRLEVGGGGSPHREGVAEHLEPQREELRRLQRVPQRLVPHEAARAAAEADGHRPGA